MAAKADTTKATDNTEAAAKAKVIDKAKRDAAARLVRENQETFNSLVKEDLAGQGIDWSPRLTPEQRAEQEFERLLAEHPHLASKISPEAVQATA